MIRDERREKEPSLTVALLLSLPFVSFHLSVRHSSSNPHGMNECSERVTWGEGGRERVRRAVGTERPTSETSDMTSDQRE